MVHPAADLHDDPAATAASGRQPPPSSVVMQGHFAFGELDGGRVAQAPAAVQISGQQPAVPQSTDGRATHHVSRDGVVPPRPQRCGQQRPRRRHLTSPLAHQGAPGDGEPVAVEAGGVGRTGDQGCDQLGLPGCEIG